MKTVISTRIFNQISQSNRPVVIKKGSLIHAGGEALASPGGCSISITLDKIKIKADVVIADIKDDALIGMDILNGVQGKPADIILSQNKILLDGNEIKCSN